MPTGIQDKLFDFDVIIPAKAGIQNNDVSAVKDLDPGFRRDDKLHEVDQPKKWSI